MRYFPIGQRLTNLASLSSLVFHKKCEVLSRNPPQIISPPVAWHSIAHLPIHLSSGKHFYIEVQLSVKRGRIGVAMQRKDQTIIEQLPAPDGCNNNTIQFFVDSSDDCQGLLFRNWEGCDESSEFTLERVAVHEAYREITEDQYHQLGPESWVHLDRSWLTYLEFHILDYCNLNCPFCSHGTPGNTRGNALTTIGDLQRFRHLIHPHEFEAVKIAGGEPTLHPEFKEICDNIKKLFPARRYDLATNGAQLDQFLNSIEIFNWIDLSHYPQRNDQIFDRLAALQRPNIFAFHKNDGMELFDSTREPHANKLFVFENCPCSLTKMVANGMIYDCPGVYGQMVPPKSLVGEKSSVPFTEDWRSGLAKLDNEELCKRCFWPVDAPRVIGQKGPYLERWKLPKRIGHGVYNRNGDFIKKIVRSAFQWYPPLEQPYEVHYVK